MLTAALALTACGTSSDPEASPLDDLHLVGIDFELNSMVIENVSEEEVSTQGLWAYRDGESFEFDIFSVEPRSTILFSMRDLGDISTATGELALADSAAFDDPESLLQYVAWGDGPFDLSATATEAGLWPEEGTAETTADAIVLIRTDPTNTGPVAWESSNQQP